LRLLIGIRIGFLEQKLIKETIMDDSFWKLRDVINDVFEAGEINFQQYLTITKIGLKKYLATDRNAYFETEEPNNLPEICTG
jgi:hypothetical protein